MVLIDEQTKSKGEPIDGSLTFLVVFTVVNLLMTLMQLARTLISCYMNLQFSKRLDGANQKFLLVFAAGNRKKEMA